MLPGFDQRFTDGAGRFEFPGAHPGRYHLVVRQIGYYPLDSAIAIAADGTLPVRIALRHLALELPPVVVTAPQRCVAPGTPAAVADPKLIAVFGQVLENARRLRLLNDSFPYEYRLQRSTWTVDRDGREELVRRDTLTQETEEGWRYRPGQLVAWRRGPSGQELFVRLPTLADFADSAFVGAHCFWLAGRDSLGADTLIRLDFAPPASIPTTDVAGAAYLDPATYQLRYTIVRLTQPERDLRDVTSLVATSLSGGARPLSRAATLPRNCARHPAPGPRAGGDHAASGQRRTADRGAVAPHRQLPATAGALAGYGSTRILMLRKATQSPWSCRPM